ALVHWRISRQPAVLWRAVVLSSGGLILIWVLIMTLFLPPLNYSKSYASVAHQISVNLPPGSKCINSNVGAAQRASFAYYGHLPFAKVGEQQCDVFLLQDSIKIPDSREQLPEHHGADWIKLWEGRRPTDNVERFRLYQRIR
ncbi:MAG: glycosyltransferase, partial [Janthinobacterium sp.]